MGAEKQELSQLTPKSVAQTALPLRAAVVLLAGIGIVFQLFFNGENEATQLKPKEAAKLQKRLKEIDEAEQYALVANSEGLYPCLHRGRLQYHLFPGEVWKYGVTSKGEFGRYTASFLVKNNVAYVVEFKGNMAECLKQEQIKLYHYPFLPENMARPPAERLPRPPYNPIMR